ncbi:MAG: dienelactone hydrolase family protein [Ferrovibrio sp.]|uniref:dienelactone hydrolase family protein n=1 Tax=Ferrovibrio sp. TaxID=1917215 RepID=UPI00391906E9
MTPGRKQQGQYSEELVAIPPFGLEGQLVLPSLCRAVIIFAHGSGSSRNSPRNRHVASALQQIGFGTLLFDLLTESEAGNRELVFDVELLAERLLLATTWLGQRMERMPPRIGYFGASTGAAAALVAAAQPDCPVGAIVNRGGRPDLAGAALPRVVAPTLLIVGSLDREVLGLNRQAMAHMRCKSKLLVVPGATHLFEEAGTLDQVIDHAGTWFSQHLLDGEAVNVSG